MASSVLGFMQSLMLRGDSSSKNGEGLGFLGTEHESMPEEERAEGCLKFRFPTYEEFRQIHKEAVKVVPAASSGSFTSSVRASIDEVEKEITETAGSGRRKNLGFDGEGHGEITGFRRNGEFIGESVIGDSDSESSTTEEIEDYDEDETAEMKELQKQTQQINEDSDNVGPNADSNSEGTESSIGDANELEPLWEHQELVEQLRIELKKVRATGLPTILEESETPKITDDLKPWKIDEFRRDDCVGELHKLYKSYRERMRKFDIINYQKMYAMGVVQLRDPLQFVSKRKPSSALKSLLLQKLPVFKNRIHGGDYPMKRLVEELQGDLEVVYVGQMCLSWEFLVWQYDKALDLWEADPGGIRRYNEVAGEFQQFQVLLQRFVEDEPFQDRPRMQNFVHAGCLNRNLLQVPVTREDKRRKRDKHEYVITSQDLVEIMEESIRIFWRFVQSDRDCCVPIHRKMPPAVSNPEDLKILMDTRKILLKKERKLKECVRSENCVLRKLRRCRKDGDDSDQVLYFFSQVDIKLVGRVLNMSSVRRDQIVWCRNKLDRISFESRKIYVEPAFLLFPS